MNPEFYKVIKSYLEKEKKKDIVTLDMGCAEVRPYSQFLIEISAKYVGLDKNQELIKKAKERVPAEKCELLIENVEDLNMPNGSFDLIVCNNMLAYTDQPKVLAKVFELLKPNGMCISYNNNTIEYSLYKIAHPYKPWYKEWPHSFIVILNTWLYKLTGIKIFRTIYNTVPALKKLLNRNQYRSLSINKVKAETPYNVIDFYYIK